MDSQRYLRCLGQPALFAATGEPIRFRTRKHLALLVYIAVENRALRRDRLAEILWPKVSVTEARHSLATALSILRPRLGIDALETSRDQVRLLPGRVGLDLERLEAGDVLGTDLTGPLEVAAFLDGFEINDSAEFTHWKDRQQARLLPIIKDALLVLIDRCRRMGDTRQIEKLADRMLALDELSEEAIRAKMEARAFAGDRLTALEIFEAWKKKLAEELQAAPSDLVEGMAIRLRRRGWERTTLANIPNVPTDQWRGRPFIGRAAEYRVLYELWEGVRKGVPGHALVLGDSGVGKTTLVQRLTTAAGLEGAAISRVQCYDVEREIPYSTLSGLIIGLLDRPGVSATSPEALAELSRTVPQIRQHFADLPNPSDSQGEAARIRLTEAFLEMLTAIAEEHPVILVVDDLHLADDVSLAVLHLIMRRVKEQSVMFVFVARPGELVASSQALRLRQSAALLGIGEIDLAPLSGEDSREMLASLVRPDEPQPGVTEQRSLLRAAAGYPMVLELLVQDWKAGGEQCLALALDAMTRDIGIAESSQRTYRQILERITQSLQSTTLSVLNVAAVLGPRLNDLDMYGIVDLTPGQTMTGLAALVTRRVFRDGMRGLEFVNELVRGAAYIGVPSSVRLILHASIADSLISRAAQGVEGLGLEIAWHCMRAGRTPEATPYLLRGARECLSVGAVHAAERALSTALPNLEATEQREARLLLAETLQEQGRWNHSLSVLDQAAPEEPCDTEVLLRMRAEHYASFQSTEDILLNVWRVRAMMERTSSADVKVRGACLLATLVSQLQSSDLAKRLLEPFNKIPTGSLNDDELSCLTEAKARMYYYAHQWDSSLQEIQAIKPRLSSRKHVNTTIGSLYNGLGAIACCQGNYGEAKAMFQDAYNVALRLGNDSARNIRAVHVALCCFRLGQYNEAVDWVLVGAASQGVGFRGYLDCQRAMYLAWGYALRNEFKRALGATSSLDSQLPASLPPWLTQVWLLAKADTLLLLGLKREALTVGSAAIGGSNPVLHSTFFAGIFARWLALTSLGTAMEIRALARIEQMKLHLNTFDALDQLEILCSDHLLRGNGPATLIAASQPIRDRLDHLPDAVAEQMIRLEVLSR
jgi:DNA-binding SARP family transcriptional activator/tetratricopeptide (TPR) repeat protein/type II secretory pathway predicted ATPase ExeA